MTKSATADHIGNAFAASERKRAQPKKAVDFKVKTIKQPKEGVITTCLGSDWGLTSQSDR